MCVTIWLGLSYGVRIGPALACRYGACAAFHLGFLRLSFGRKIWTGFLFGIDPWHFLLALHSIIKVWVCVWCEMQRSTIDISSMSSVNTLTPGPEIYIAWGAIVRHPPRRFPNTFAVQMSRRPTGLKTPFVYSVCGGV
jgi:hypothetical protein